jgi:hypothetical protein
VESSEFGYLQDSGCKTQFTATVFCVGGKRWS